MLIILLITLLIGTGYYRQNLSIFNRNFSFDICSISAKFLENVVYSLPEGSLSPNFDLDPSYFFVMYKLKNIIFHFYLHFIHKNVTMT